MIPNREIGIETPFRCDKSIKIVRKWRKGRRKGERRLKKIRTIDKLFQQDILITFKEC